MPTQYSRPLLKNLAAKLISFALAPRAIRNSLHKAVYVTKFENWKKQHPFEQDIDRYAMYERIIKSRGLDSAIDYLEFGVYRGDTMRWWLDHNKAADSRFIGFDSFRGLPENWRDSFPKGTFSTDGVTPDIDDTRCGFKVGWFHETLPGFVAEYRSVNRRVIHLDGDLYSSTLYPMTVLAGSLHPGDILIFDDFGGYLHQYRAMEDFFSAFDLDYKVVGVAQNYLVTAFEIVADS